MKAFLIGLPGVGKTTIVRRFLKAYSRKVVGFLTPEIRKNGKRMGFEIELIPSGEKLLFASVERISPVRFGKYWISMENLEKVIENVKNLTEKEKADLIVIDEIGKMEMISPKFREFVEELVSSPKNLLCVVHRAYAKKFEKYGKVIFVTTENRDTLPELLLKLFETR